MSSAEEDVFQVFRSHANPEKAKQMSAYMRDQFPFLGIQTPHRKALSKEIIKQLTSEPVNWDFVNNCWKQPEREFQYVALDYLAKAKQQLTPKDIPRLKHLAVTKSWWDTVDGLDQVVGDIALRHPEVNDTLLAWSKDQNFWLRRIAIDHQLGRKTNTNMELLAAIIQNNLGQSEFFINKAIGWALRDYSKTNPAWVKSFLMRHEAELAALTKKEAAKYL